MIFFCIAFFSYKASLKYTFDRQQETASSKNKKRFCSCFQFSKCCILLYWHVTVLQQWNAGFCFNMFFLFIHQNGRAQSGLGILEAGLIVTVLSFLFFFLYFCSVLSCPAHPPMLQTLNIAQVCSQPYCCIVTNDTLAALQPLIPVRDYMYSQGLKLAGPLDKGKLSIQISSDMRDIA